MSKISIFMHVTRKVFGLDKDPRWPQFQEGRCGAFEMADRRHSRQNQLLPALPAVQAKDTSGLF